jgi:hypothetical protein
MSTESLNTKVITGLVRLSYANLFTPTSIDEKGDKKYNTAILIPKSDKVTLDKLNTVVKALTEQVKAKNNGKLPPKFKTPLRDGDDEKPDDPAYADHFFLNASSKSKPGIVSRIKDEKGKPIEITDEEEVYSGCYCFVSLNLFTFDTAGNKGIGCGLNNVMKVKDGERFSGRADAAEDFADVTIEEDEDGFLD